MEKRNELLTLSALALVNAALMVLLHTQRAFASMWVESYAFEQVDDYFRMLNLSSSTNSCWLQIGDHSLPLTYHSYIGVAAFSYLPSVSLWLQGLVTDPFIYRDYGIILFVISSFLMYGILRLFFTRSHAWFGSLILMTTPTIFLTTLTDWQIILISLCLLLLAMFFVVLAARRQSIPILALAALFSGAVLLGRFEYLIWPFAAAVIYLVCVRPPFLRLWLAQLRRRPLRGVLLVACFVLGALPTLVYQTTCPYNLVYQVSLWSSEGKVTASAAPMTQKMVTRVQQMWDHNLLALKPEYLMLAQNWVFALVWLVAVLGLLVKSARDRQPDPWVLLILVAVPFSTFTSGGLRLEHITFLQVFFVLALISGLNWWKQRGSLFLGVTPVLALALAGNVWATYTDWRIWNSVPATESTALNQSDPVLLMAYLSQHYPNDRLIYTNIGLYQYAQYLSRGKLRNEDFTSWDGDERFRDRVLEALSVDTTRRVFIAVGRERDGTVGTLLRTRLLYALLDQYQVPYTVTKLPSPRNAYAYEIITVDPGVRLTQQLSRDMVLAEVADVRIEGDLVVGSVLGVGFEPGASIRINRMHIASTAYGHSRWMTFSFPVSLLGDATSFSVQILSAGKAEGTAVVTATLTR